MGCWYGTCGVSQLPIMPGDDVVLFPLLVNEEREDGGHGFSYATDQYGQLSLPVYGKYDDYGSIEAAENNGQGVYLHVQALLERHWLTPKNKAVSPPKDADEFVREHLKEALYEGTGYMLVHRFIFEELITEIGSRIPYKKEKSFATLITEDMESLLHSFQALKEELPHLLKRQEELREAKKEAEENGETPQILTDEFLTVFRQVNAVKYMRLEEHYRSNSFVSRFYQSHLNKLTIGLLLETFVSAEPQLQSSMKQAMVDFILFDEVMDVTRKLWTPQAGAGSQTTETFLQEIIAKQVLLQKEKRIQKYLQDNIVEETKMDQFKLNFGKDSIRY